MLVADQVVGVAAVPLNVTVLVPCVAPKLVPVIVTAVPTGPLVGDRLVSVGATVTVKVSALLARPPTVTTTLPVVAPVGTGTTMLVADQLVGVAAVPLNLTVLVPCVAPKLVPAIVTAVPTGPLVGDRLVRRRRASVTVNGSALLARPPTVTTTLPVVAPVGTGTTMLVADQLVGVAAVPLNVTVLVPCVAPKLVPVIVTAVPTGPLVGDRLVSVGATVTVKVSAVARQAADRDDHVARRRACRDRDHEARRRPARRRRGRPVERHRAAARVAPKLVPVIVTACPPARSSATGSSASGPPSP